MQKATSHDVAFCICGGGESQLLGFRRNRMGVAKSFVLCNQRTDFVTDSAHLHKIIKIPPSNLVGIFIISVRIGRK
jgi:hypothetical protein